MIPEVELIIDLLRKSFGKGAPRTISDTAFPEAPDIDKALRGVSMDSIEAKSILLKHDTALIFLTDESVNYYLPIYIKAALEGAEELIDIIIYAIVQRDLDYSREQLEILHSVISSFKTLVHHQDEYIDEALIKLSSLMGEGSIE